MTRPAIWGALLAAGLGANVGLHRLRGMRELPAGIFSLWDYGRAGDSQGPRAAPLDIGRVLQVGAGAVGCALDFFLSFLGIGGQWQIVDGDQVDVTNLNRQFLFIARDAGFPAGQPANKASRVAALLGLPAGASPAMYGDDLAVVNGSYDVVLALANDNGVRSFLQGRQPTILLHATTSPNWQAQLHRHAAGHDDCIDCRLPAGTPRFTCATEDVETDTGEHFDAAVPPLSGMAGLLLAAELAKLQAGALLETPHNYTAVELFGPQPVVRRYVRKCREGCRVRLPAATRAVVDADSRFRHLDPEIAVRD